LPIASLPGELGWPSSRQPVGRKNFAKVDAACRFAIATGKQAAISALADLEGILAGEAGTTITVAEAGLVYTAPSRLMANTARK
jgi:hypothetical protein